MAARARAMAVLMLILIMMMLGAEAEDSTAPMALPVKEALYATIAGFVGRGWNGSGLYPDPCGWTPIQGVSCDLYDADGLWYPTAITIGPVLDNSLVCAPDASFTPQLFQLKHLKSVTLYSCFTAGHTPAAAIPSAGWHDLSSSLESLEFRSNPGLTGPVPSAIGSLSSLQSLVIIDTSVSGELPSELSNLQNLRRLVITGNRITGHIPGSLGVGMTNLLILDMSRNNLTGPLPPSLGSMPSLLKMDLSGNSLSGGMPREFSNLRSLTLLDLRSNKLSNALGAAIQGMGSLEELLLSSNPLGGRLGDLDWSKMGNLTTVDLSNAGLSGSIPRSLTGIQRLRFMVLDNNNLTGGVPEGFQEMPLLSGLYLQGNRLEGELGFRGEFYGRMGRRFAAWGNQGLCFRAGEGDDPLGLQECRGSPAAGRPGEGYSAGTSGPLASCGVLVGCCCWAVLIVVMIGLSPL